MNEPLRVYLAGMGIDPASPEGTIRADAFQAGVASGMAVSRAVIETLNFTHRSQIGEIETRALKKEQKLQERIAELEHDVESKEVAFRLMKKSADRRKEWLDTAVNALEHILFLWDARVNRGEPFLSNYDDVLAVRKIVEPFEDAYQKKNNSDSDEWPFGFEKPKD